MEMIQMIQLVVQVEFSLKTDFSGEGVDASEIFKVFFGGAGGGFGGPESRTIHNISSI